MTSDNAAPGSAAAVAASAEQTTALDPGVCPPFCPSEGDSTLATIIITAFAVLAALIVLVIAFFLLRMLLRRLRDLRWTIPPAPVDDPAETAFPPVHNREAVAAAVETGLVDLSDAESDPRRAVIACWVRLEEAADQAGLSRLAGDAPADLVSRLLGDYQVDRSTLDEFAGVYRMARYATHPIDEPMRAAALLALGQMRTALRARAEAP